MKSPTRSRRPGLDGRSESDTSLPVTIRTAPFSASHSARAPGLSLHGGGMAGGAVPCSIESASRSIARITSGGGRRPSSASVADASVSRWV